MDPRILSEDDLNRVMLASAPEVHPSTLRIWIPNLIASHRALANQLHAAYAHISEMATLGNTRLMELENLKDKLAEVEDACRQHLSMLEKATQQLVDLKYGEMKDKLAAVERERDELKDKCNDAAVELVMLGDMFLKTKDDNAALQDRCARLKRVLRDALLY